jgi:hypothetical protein
MRRRSIIVIEANEIPFKVFDYFRDRQPNSALARMMEQSRQYCTHSEDRTRFIMPWTTWPSMHRGVNDELHQIFKFGQWEVETDKKYPPIWSLLTDGGIRTGVFSSMQSAPLPENSSQYAFYFPDMFATSTATQPPELADFQEFNLTMTRESARNVSRRIDMGGAAQVVLNSRRLGIRASTYADIASQLIQEVFNPAVKSRRRAYQPIMLFDVFYRQLERTRPQYCTFFTNHVAAAMHRYWAAVFPEDYEEFNLEHSWVEKYRGEIEFAMAKLDKIVGRLVKFVDRNDDYMLALTTSMGQAAIPASHVRQFLTITNVPQFMRALGLQPGDYEERPAMVPDFSFSVAAGKIEQFQRGLVNLNIDGKKADFHRDNRFFHISLYDERQDLKEAQLGESRVALQDLGIGYLVHEDEVACTAQHIPQGVLLVYSPHSASVRETTRPDISALSFAPSVLRHFGVPIPAYMKQNDLFAFG